WVLFPDASAEVVAQNVNLLIMVFGVAGAVSQIFLIAPLVKRFGEQRLVVLGGLLLMGSAIGISTGSLPVVLVAMLAFSLGFGVSFPSLQAIMTRFGSNDTTGKRLGLLKSAFSLAFIVAPLMAGFLLENFGAQTIFYNGALLMGVATVLGILIMHITVPGTAQVKDEAPEGGLLRHLHH